MSEQICYYIQFEQGLRNTESQLFGPFSEPFGVHSPAASQPRIIFSESRRVFAYQDAERRWHLDAGSDDDSYLDFHIIAEPFKPAYPTPKCLICGKTLKFLYAEHGHPDDAGVVTISCGYGSKHDMMAGEGPYVSHICDDCFAHVKERGVGYDRSEWSIHSEYCKDEQSANRVLEAQRLLESLDVPNGWVWSQDSWVVDGDEWRRPIRLSTAEQEDAGQTTLKIKFRPNTSEVESIITDPEITSLASP